MYQKSFLAGSLICTMAIGANVEALGQGFPIETTRIATGFNRSVGATFAPGDDSRLFVIEKPGNVRILNLDSGQINAQPFLNITSLVGGGTTFGTERGLLGIAFHPEYQKNGRFFVHYTNSAGASVIREYLVSEDNPDLANPNAFTTIMTVSQPFNNHNAGWLDFGPDGYLYIAMGDGGSGGDPQNNGQNINSLLGSMLRVDVNNTQGALNYAIPADNPFVGQSGRDEIWAYGLRNSWRNSFDRQTGDLYIADVGQNAWEEVNFQPASSPGGENYGWRCFEGNAQFNTTGCPAPSTMTFPVHVYPIFGAGGANCAIIGGYVYRGCAIPELQGTYLFGDFCSNRVWSFEIALDRQENYEAVNHQDLTSLISPSIEGFPVTSIASFAEDASGEVYIITQPGAATGGSVFKIIPANGAQPNPDLNCDGVVDVFDLLILLGAWGPCVDCPEDLNGDGVVDVFDLLILLGEWG